MKCKQSYVDFIIAENKKIVYTYSILDKKGTQEVSPNFPVFSPFFVPGAQDFVGCQKPDRITGEFLAIQLFSSFY